MTTGQTITTVERAADVLACFADSTNRTLGVTEIARQLDLSKAVVHRILASLRKKGFVEFEPETRRYSLGPAALTLGLSYLRQVDVPELGRPLLRGLSNATGETATISLRTGNARVYVDQVTPPSEVKMTVVLGRPYPLHAGSSSKAILAFLPDEVIDEYLSAELEALTDRTLVDPQRLRRELDEIRSKGYARSCGERQPGAASIAAPFFDHRGTPVGSMSVCGPADRFGPRAEDAAELLLEATRQLSRRLGHHENGS